MKIALLAPAGAMHRYNGDFHKALHYAPITLTLLAALVPEELNAEVKIYDETAEKIPLDLEADVVGITCITGTADRCYRYADYFRQKGMTVLMGGPHVSILPEEALAHADCVMVGMGDEIFPRALLDFRKGCLKPVYRQNPNMRLAGRPLPRKDLLNKKRYITLNTVEAVRGCNLCCSFCAYPAAFGRKVYTRPVKEVIDEIKQLKGRAVVFPDVNLIADEAYAEELFTAMIPLKKWWFGLTTTEIGKNKALLELFEKSGCKGLLIGFESVNQETQRNMRKGINQVATYKALMEDLHDHGIMVMGCFALGGDEDGKDVFIRTVEMCEEAKIDLPRFSVITPFPGTPFYKQLEAEGRICEHRWALYDVEHVVYEPRNMTKKELEEGMAFAWKQAYSLKSIFKRLDFTRPKTLKTVFLLLNIGYRKYAKAYETYNVNLMTDNSDIPAGKEAARQEIKRNTDSAK